VQLAPPGQIEPWTRRPLAELPASVKKLWYQTTVAERDRSVRHEVVVWQPPSQALAPRR